MGVTHGPLWTLEDEYSMQFDGTDDSITTGLDCASATHPDISISCWLKTSSAPGLTFPVGVECPYSQYISLGLLNGGGLYYKANGGWVYGGSVADGNWHNVIWTFSYDNPTSGDMTVKVYKDGNTTPVIDTVDNTYQLPALSGDLFIGSEDGTQYYFPGLVDEVGVWDRILTPTEVSAIYSNGNPINLTPFNPLVWYRMGDNAVFKDPQWLLPENSNKDKNTNYSLEFDGTDDHVQVPSDPSIYPTTALAISIWVKLDVQTGAGPYIISGGLDGGTGLSKGYAIHLHSAGVHFRLGNGSANTLNSGDVAVGVWTHLLCNYNGTEIQTWVNGVTEGTTTTVSSPIVYDDTKDLYLGTRYIWGSHIFTGNLDEIAIFNTDQSSNISFIYSGGTNGISPDLSSLNPVGYWKMGENGTYKYPQWLLPNNENKDKESNYSLKFDGTDEYVKVADASSGPLYDIGTGDFTISIWSANDFAGGFQQMLFNWSSTGIQFFRWSDGGFAAYIGDSTEHRSTFTIPGDGSWHHYCITRSSGLCDMYVDGVSVITQFTETGSLATAVPTLIGTRDSLAADWIGNIDEVAIWDSIQDVSLIYGNGTPPDISSLNPVSYWKMGDMSYSGGTADIWVVPDQGLNDWTGLADNMTIEARVGDAPNSINNALSYNMEIEDRVGYAPSSSGNTLSYNMELNDRVNDTPE